MRDRQNGQAQTSARQLMLDLQVPRQRKPHDTMEETFGALAFALRGPSQGLTMRDAIARSGHYGQQRSRANR